MTQTLDQYLAAVRANATRDEGAPVSPRFWYLNYANDVPRLLAIIEAMKKRIIHRDGCGWGRTVCEACDTLDEIYRIAKGEL